MDKLLLAEKDKKRFWAKVRKTRRCWLWTGATMGTVRHQYGSFRLRDRACLAHRIVYRNYVGKIGRACVLHKCDEPACLNPKHLFLGTHADNAADKVRKGRCNQPRGAKHFRSKLIPRQVRRIRARYAAGESHKKIAKEYGVSHYCVWALLNGISWAWLV